MKTVIITGGNSGLGYYCAQKLAQDSNWYIVLACRDRLKADRAVKNIQEISDSQQIEAMTLDLASLTSIRAFNSEFTSRELPPLSAVVCNAGVQFIQRQTYTKEGFDTTFGVNHLGHFLLVNLLLKQLVAPGRIIFVSSDTHDSSKTTGMPAPYWRDPQLMAHPEQDSALKSKDIGTIGRIAYTTSKLCNVLCAYELSRLLQQQQISTESNPITVNVFNPGLMPGSGLATDYTAVAKFVWHNILPILSKFIPNVNTMEQSAEGLARLIADPELANVTGKYFSGFKMMNSSIESGDRAKAKQLWNASVELTQLKPQETILQLSASNL
ncbi:MAG TPA: SDR family NAD(P)-dependent oxidoreductase [Coleofasciculaceae cyanobacterium]|jgi:light-dependent protochlorophyllide reductase